MLDHAYYQIWRPGPDPSYVTDRRFSPYLTEDCDGYAACENRLRALLTAAQKRGGPLFKYSSPTVYEALKRVTFELQEAVRQVLKAHGKQTVRCVPPAHIALLEAPMALSRYSCRIRLDGEELSLSPFRSLGSQNGPSLEPPGGRPGTAYHRHRRSPLPAVRPVRPHLRDGLKSRKAQGGGHRLLHQQKPVFPHAPGLGGRGSVRIFLLSRTSLSPGPVSLLTCGCALFPYLYFKLAADASTMRKNFSLSIRNTTSTLAGFPERWA